MKIAVIGPVKNEVQFIGYSIMAVWPHVDEFIYSVAPSSNDGTIDLLQHIAKRYGKIRLLIDKKYDFVPSDMAAYNASFNDCIGLATGAAVWFLHPDMIVTNPKRIDDLKEGPLAWSVKMTSYAGDMQRVISKGRADQWKNLHAKKFGLHYYGGYGSVNEDFYFSEITGKSYRHFGTDFQRYPFEVGSSGIEINHYCELKSYKRRLEKMKLCLKTQHPDAADDWIDEVATHHPRVTLEQSGERFGKFVFEPAVQPIPEIFAQYKEEFDPFQTKKEPVNV